MVTVAVEPARQDDVLRFIGALDAFLLPLSPPEFHFGLDVEQMDSEATTTFVARDEAGRALGMGALTVHPGGLGEVKRMYVDPAARGRRIGGAILDAIENLARTRGLSELKLETGTADAMGDAFRLYEHHGFSRCGTFLDYPDSGHSRFYEKKL